MSRRTSWDGRVCHDHLQVITLSLVTAALQEPDGLMQTKTNLDKVLDVIQTNKTEEKETKGNGGLIGALIAGILVMIITAVFGFIAWRRGKELAKLLHEKAVAEENLHQAGVDATLAKDDTVRAEATTRIEAAQYKIVEIVAQREVLQEEHRAAKQRLDEFTSWDDVDRYLGGQ